MSALVYAYAIRLHDLSLSVSSVETACHRQRPSQHSEDGDSLVQGHFPITQRVTLMPSNISVLTLSFDETDRLNTCHPREAGTGTPLYQSFEP